MEDDQDKRNELLILDHSDNNEIYVVTHSIQRGNFHRRRWRFFLPEMTRVVWLGTTDSRTTSLLLATPCSASGASNNCFLLFFVRVGSTGGVVRSKWVCVPSGAYARRNRSSKGGGGYPRLDHLWGRNGGQSLGKVPQPLFAVLCET